MRLSRHGLWAALACWLLFVGGFAVWLGVGAVLGCGQLTPGDSNYGEGHWTWTPPGVACSWPIDGAVHTEYPPFGRWIVIWGTIAFPIALVGGWRMQRERS